MAHETAYELDGVSYSYLGRFPALSDINLKIKKGERICLLGANGSGKSTLLNMLAGLTFPDKGSMKFFGKKMDERNLSEPSFRKFFRSSVGIVFQNPDIQLFNSSVTNEILFGLMQLGCPEKEAALRMEKYISLMEIGHLAPRHPQYLSIGEKKRVAIASVLAMEPGIFLFDEPTAGLDPRTVRHLLDTITSLGEKGSTLIMATQDIHIASEVAERTIILGEDKTIVRDGGVHEVLNDRGFLEKHNLVHSHVHMHDGHPHVHPHEHPDHHHPHQ